MPPRRRDGYNEELLNEYPTGRNLDEDELRVSYNAARWHGRQTMRDIREFDRRHAGHGRLNRQQQIQIASLWREYRTWKLIHDRARRDLFSKMDEEAARQRARRHLYLDATGIFDPQWQQAVIPAGSHGPLPRHRAVWYYDSLARATPDNNAQWQYFYNELEDANINDEIAEGNM